MRAAADVVGSCRRGVVVAAAISYAVVCRMVVAYRRRNLTVVEAVAEIVVTEIDPNPVPDPEIDVDTSVDVDSGRRDN